MTTSAERGLGRALVTLLLVLALVCELAGARAMVTAPPPDPHVAAPGTGEVAAAGSGVLAATEPGSLTETGTGDDPALPDHVDAVVQLGGAPDRAYARSRQAASSGRAPVLVESVPPEAERIERSACAPQAGLEVICFSPEPSTTRGEARELGDLVRNRGWHRVLVFATGPDHVGRSRFVLGRCTDAELLVTAWPIPRSHAHELWQAVYQAGGWVRAGLEGGC